MLKIILSAAAGTELIWLVSLHFTPWKENVPAFLALFGAAFAAYVFAWKKIRPSSGEDRTAVWLILGAGLAFRATVFFSPPSLSDDIHRYLWDGRVQLAGVNPYLHSPEAPELVFLRDGDHARINHSSLRTVYPPLSQWIFRAAAAVSPGLGAQRLAFMGFDTALMVLLVLYLRRKKRPATHVLLYAWNPLVLVEFSSSGHLDPLSLFFLVAGLFALESGRPLAAGTAWGLSFLGKFGSLILLPWIAMKRRVRPTAWTFAGAVAAGYISFFLWPFAEVRAAFFSGTTAYVKTWYFNASLFALASEWLPLSARSIKGLLFGGVGLFALLLARRLPENRVIAYAGAVWAACVLVSPVVHPWYVAWLAPFLCFYPLWSGIAFTGVAALSYVVLHRYAATGAWTLPAWVPLVEYGTVAALFLHERFFRSPAPILRPPSSIPLPTACRAAVLIPALNEEKALPSVLAEIPRDKAPWIFVIDNGSSDRTADVARAAGAVVTREARRGYGRAVLAGMARLPDGCGVVVVMDGDHSDFPEDLPTLLAPIERGEADFVIGSRILGGAPPGSLTPQQRFGNGLSCLLIRFFWGRAFTDLGPFRAIRRDALDALRMEDTGFGWNVEMQIKALRAGVRIIEVPVRYRPRIGVSKISGTLKGSTLAGIKILWTIFKHGVWVVPPADAKSA